MKISEVWGAFVTAAIFLTLLPACVPIPAVMVRTPRTIRLVDSRTESPIEGAVVLRSWHKCDAAFPAGGDCSDFTFREVRSNSAGNSWFATEFKPYINLILIPVVWWNWTEEKPTLVFKPGYKTIVDKPGASLFKLEKIPDSYWRRSEELENAEDYGYVDDVHSTKVLKDALEKEAEEIKLLPIDHCVSNGTRVDYYA